MVDAEPANHSFCNSYGGHWKHRTGNFRREKNPIGQPEGLYTMTTCTSERRKAFTASSETPSSVIKISISVTGQITAGLVSPTLLESATITTCLACLVIARKTAASSASMVVAPSSGSTPHTPMKTLSITTVLRDSTAAAPMREKAPGQRRQPPV